MQCFDTSNSKFGSKTSTKLSYGCKQFYVIVLNLLIYKSWDVHVLNIEIRMSWCAFQQNWRTSFPNSRLADHHFSCKCFFEEEVGEKSENMSKELPFVNLHWLAECFIDCHLQLFSLYYVYNVRFFHCQSPGSKVVGQKGLHWRFT